MHITGTYLYIIATLDCDGSPLLASFRMNFTVMTKFDHQPTTANLWLIQGGYRNCIAQANCPRAASIISWIGKLYFARSMLARTAEAVSLEHNIERPCTPSFYERCTHLVQQFRRLCSKYTCFSCC